MKIAHFIYDDIDNPWLGGGGSVRLTEIYKRFPKDIDIAIYTGAFPGAKSENIDEIKFKRLGIGINYSMSRLTYIITAISLIKKIKADIIIEDFSPYSPIFSQISQKSVVLYQNIFKTHFIKSKSLFGLIPFFIERLYIRTTKSVIVSSGKLAKMITHTSDKIFHIATIPYGVNKILFSTTPDEKNCILFLGRLDIYQKGIDTLLKAFNLVKEDLDDLKLIIAGSGKDESKVRKLITDLNLDDHVEMVGRVAGKQKYELLSNCLFLCMPSRFESWGIVAAEGMACAKAVIATKIEGLDEVIDEKTGILVPPDDPEALARAMIRLAKDGRLRKTLGARARAKAREYDWNRRAEATLRFYEEVIKRRYGK